MLSTAFVQLCQRVMVALIRCRVDTLSKIVEIVRDIAAHIGHGLLNAQLGSTRPSGEVVVPVIR